MTLPQDLRYSDTHEWARLEKDGTVVVGITDFAVKQLQDLVFIDLPKAGARVEKGKRFGEIESVKAVSDLIAPISGTIAAVNDALAKNLDPLAAEPYGQGWMIRVKPDAPGDAALAGLLDAAAYEKVAAAGGH